MINRELISKFKERIHKDNFVLNKYRNINGKNLWSCICSCVDWISVAVTYLSENQTPQFTVNDDLTSVNVYTYISCVDMIYEAINQLHRVFIDVTSVPYNGIKDIFTDEHSCKDDNSYFKLIRACFGAHPVNLHDFFSNGKKERRFASWSGEAFSKGDYGVILYSNEPDVDDISFDISFSEINAFLERTYEYINEIIKSINEDEEKFLSKQRDSSIKCVTDEYEQLSILEEENKKRSNFDYYEYIIENLKVIFGTEITNPKNEAVVNEYKDYIRPAIKELYDALQKMDGSEILTYDRIAHLPHQLKHSESSGYVELSDLVLCDLESHMIFLPSLKEYISSHIELDGTESYDELFVLSNAAIFAKAQQDELSSTH